MISVTCDGAVKDRQTEGAYPYKVKLISLPSVILFQFKESEDNFGGVKTQWNHFFLINIKIEIMKRLCG